MPFAKIEDHRAYQRKYQRSYRRKYPLKYLWWNRKSKTKLREQFIEKMGGNVLNVVLKIGGLCRLIM